MLKRLSFNSTPLDSPALYPLSPGNFQPSNQHPPSPSPAFPFPQTNSHQAAISSQILHNTIETLTTLLIALDEYRTLALHISKCEGKISKVLTQLGYSFTSKGAGSEGGKSEVIAGALNASSSFFEVLSEVDIKFAKAVQKEYDSLNETVAKGFKKLAKEEKVFDESLESLNSKVLKATTSYEKSRPLPGSRSRPSSSDVQSLTDSHNRYISSLSTLSNSISQLKQSHSESLGEKREKMLKEVGRSLAGLSEMKWKNGIDSVKRGGEKIGEVLEKGVFCEKEVHAPIEENFPNPSTNNDNTHVQIRSSRSQPFSRDSDSNHLQSFSSESTYYHTQSLQPPSFPSHSQSRPQSQSRSNSIQPPSSPYQSDYSNLHPDRPSSQSSQYATNTSTSDRTDLPLARPSVESFRRPLPNTRGLSPGQPSPPLPTSPRPLAKSFELSLSNPSSQTSAITTQSQSTLRNYSSEDSNTSSSRPLPSPNEELRRIVAPREYLPNLQANDDTEDEIHSGLMSPNGIMDVWNSGFRLEENVNRNQVDSVYKPIATRYENQNERRESREERDRDKEDELRRSESTMSEKSFVARMKEKYAQEKENLRDEETLKIKKSIEVEKDRPIIPRSNSRVANLAAKYSLSPPSTEFTSNSTTSSFLNRPTPSRHRSQSVQPEIFQPKNYELSNTDPNRQNFPSASTHLSSSNQSQPQPNRTNPRSDSRQSLPPTPSYSSNNSSESQLPYKSNNTKIRFSDSALASTSTTSNFQYQQQQQYQSRTSTRSGNSPPEPHSSVCGCEDCSRTNYGSIKGGVSKGNVMESKREEEEIQRDLRKIGNATRPDNSRRVSMPIIFGSTSTSRR